MPPFVDRPEGTDWAREFELWEHQGTVLTAGDLRRALDEVPGDTPVRVEFYDGSSSRSLLAVEVGFVGVGPRPSAVAVTVVGEPS
jgi:hypothetical protein